MPPEQNWTVSEPSNLAASQPASLCLCIAKPWLYLWGTCVHGPPPPSLPSNALLFSLTLSLSLSPFWLCHIIENVWNSNVYVIRHVGRCYYKVCNCAVHFNKSRVRVEESRSSLTIASRNDVSYDFSCYTLYIQHTREISFAHCLRQLHRQGQIFVCLIFHFEHTHAHSKLALSLSPSLCRCVSLSLSI